MAYGHIRVFPEAPRKILIKKTSEILPCGGHFLKWNKSGMEETNPISSHTLASWELSSQKQRSPEARKVREGLEKGWYEVPEPYYKHTVSTSVLPKTNTIVTAFNNLLCMLQRVLSLSFLAYVVEWIRMDSRGHFFMYQVRKLSWTCLIC